MILPAYVKEYYDMFPRLAEPGFTVKELINDVKSLPADKRDRGASIAIFIALDVADKLSASVADKKVVLDALTEELKVTP